MGRGRFIFDRITEDASLSLQAFPGQPVVEIAGDSRVLIENHFGIKEYSCERITVNVTYGRVCVSGCRLEVMRMTREQLVIGGRINGIILQRRG